MGYVVGMTVDNHIIQNNANDWQQYSFKLCPFRKGLESVFSFGVDTVLHCIQICLFILEQKVCFDE